MAKHSSQKKQFSFVIFVCSSRVAGQRRSHVQMAGGFLHNICCRTSIPPSNLGMMYMYSILGYREAEQVAGCLEHLTTAG